MYEQRGPLLPAGNAQAIPQSYGITEVRSLKINFIVAVFPTVLAEMVKLLPVYFWQLKVIAPGCPVVLSRATDCRSPGMLAPNQWPSAFCFQVTRAKVSPG